MQRLKFYALCQANRDLKFERNVNGDLIILSPVAGEGGNLEAGLITDVEIWNRQTGLGKVFSSSTIFKLPNRADRYPDVSWVNTRAVGSPYSQPTPQIPTANARLCN